MVRAAARPDELSRRDPGENSSERAPGHSRFGDIGLGTWIHLKQASTRACWGRRAAYWGRPWRTTKSEESQATLTVRETGHDNLEFVSMGCLIGIGIGPGSGFDILNYALAPGASAVIVVDEYLTAEG